MNLKYDLITITMNSEKTLQRTLDSVVAQKYLPTRYIFIDGKSEDQTANIIKEFIQIHPQIEVVFEKQVGKGISQAWNQALQYTQSEIISLLNSDDWFRSDTMEKVMKEFGKNKNLEILSGAILYCQEENDENPKLMSPQPIWQMPFKMCFMHPATFVKKSVYEKIGGFNEELRCSMDYDFMYRAVKAGVKIKCVETVFTEMLAGGLANSTRKTARRETRNTALKYSPILPWFSYFGRALFNR